MPPVENEMTVNGTDDDDVLVGTNNGDTPNGLTGTDTTAGGAGNDLFQYLLDDLSDLPALGADVITGFEIGKDKIDMYDPFVDFEIASPDVVDDGGLRLLVNGNNTLPQSDNGGDSYVTLAALQNVTNATLADVIFHQGELE
jgi:hypothetical protein